MVFKSVFMQRLYDNKVFLSGLFLAILTAASELFTNDSTQVTTYTLIWSLSLAVLSYLANTLRAQIASIMGMLTMTATSYFAAHSDANGLDVKEIMIFYVLPFAIKCISLFNTSPPKNKAYEYDPNIEDAKEPKFQAPSLFSKNKNKTK